MVPAQVLLSKDFQFRKKLALIYIEYQRTTSFKIILQVSVFRNKISWRPNPVIVIFSWNQDAFIEPIFKHQILALWPKYYNISIHFFKSLIVFMIFDFNVYWFDIMLFFVAHCNLKSIINTLRSQIIWLKFRKSPKKSKICIIKNVYGCNSMYYRK